MTSSYFVRYLFKFNLFFIFTTFVLKITITVTVKVPFQQRLNPTVIKTFQRFVSSFLVGSTVRLNFKISTVIVESVKDSEMSYIEMLEREVKVRTV